MSENKKFSGIVKSILLGLLIVSVVYMYINSLSSVDEIVNLKNKVSLLEDEILALEFQLEDCKYIEELTSSKLSDCETRFDETVDFIDDNYILSDGLTITRSVPYGTIRGTEFTKYMTSSPHRNLDAAMVGVELTGYYEIYKLLDRVVSQTMLYYTTEKLREENTRR